MRNIPHEGKAPRISLHEGKSMLKHNMRKCKVVSYAKIHEQEGYLDEAHSHENDNEGMQTMTRSFQRKPSSRSVSIRSSNI